MKRLAAPMLLVLTIHSIANADYSPPPLFDMIGCSDLVAVGRVELLKEDTYLFRIDRVLAGKVKGEVVEIQRFRVWAYSRRWDAYREGERLVIFADRDPGQAEERRRDLYYLRSAGCESEFPIENGDVYCFTIPTGEGSPGYTIGTHEGMFRCKLATLIDAIEGYQSLYLFEAAEPEHRNLGGRVYFLKAKRIQRRHPREESEFSVRRSPVREQRVPSNFAESVKRYAHRSPLHKYLVNSTEKVAVKLGAPDIGLPWGRTSDGPILKVKRYMPVGPAGDGSH